jgi:flagellar motor protein MotB
MRSFVQPGSGRKSRGEPWQVIYTDLMTIIMVFFVILWSLNQGKDVGISETIGDVTARMINLPGDILFSPGKSTLSDEGSEVFKQIFFDESGSVLQFDDNGFTKRLIVIHGHTDGDGKKDANFQLGFRRAFAAYSEIKLFNPEIENHAVICSHADNTPQLEVPKFEGEISQAQREALKQTKAQNRRITIEDTIVNKSDEL